MKKLILLGALSVLLYSAPGHTGKRGKGHQRKFTTAAAKANTRLQKAESKAARKEPLARLEASVTKFEKQATTTYCQHLLTALQAWKKKTDGAYTKAYAAQVLTHDKTSWNPLRYMSIRHGCPEIIAPENAIISRVAAIVNYTHSRAAAARVEARRAQRDCRAEAAQGEVESARTYCTAQVEAAAPVALADDVYGTRALCTEILRGDIPSGRRLQEIWDISERISGILLGEQKEALAQTEQAYRQLLKDEIRHNEEVRDLVDDEQVKVQPSFDAVAKCYEPFFNQCYEPFFNQRAAEFDAGAFDEAHPPEGLAEALWTSAEDLFSFFNKNVEGRRDRCSYTIALAQEELGALVGGHTSPAEEAAADLEEAAAR